MRHVFVTAAVGLIIGATLSAAQYLSPQLLPWAVGFMLACLATNLRFLTEEKRRTTL